MPRKQESRQEAAAEPQQELPVGGAVQQLPGHGVWVTGSERPELGRRGLGSGPAGGRVTQREPACLWKLRF